jgi:DNA-directed RNA polymerase sigma subunit (sigma70/sigma32)
MEAEREKLFSDNLALVPEVAGSYADRGVPIVDLIWVGAQGLHEAAEKFNFNGNYQFKYYAMHYIRRHVMRKVKPSGLWSPIRNRVVGNIGVRVLCFPREIPMSRLR